MVEVCQPVLVASVLNVCLWWWLHTVLSSYLKARHVLRARFIIPDSECELVFHIDFLMILNFGGQILLRSDSFMLGFASSRGWRRARRRSRRRVSAAISTLVACAGLSRVLFHPWFLCRTLFLSHLSVLWGGVDSRGDLLFLISASGVYLSFFVCLLLICWA